MKPSGSWIQSSNDHRRGTPHVGFGWCFQVQQLFASEGAFAALRYLAALLLAYRKSLAWREDKLRSLLCFSFHRHFSLFWMHFPSDHFPLPQMIFWVLRIWWFCGDLGRSGLWWWQHRCAKSAGGCSPRPCGQWCLRSGAPGWEGDLLGRPTWWWWLQLLRDCHSALKWGMDFCFLWRCSCCFKRFEGDGQTTDSGAKTSGGAKHRRAATSYVAAGFRELRRVELRFVSSLDSPVSVWHGLFSERSSKGSVFHGRFYGHF